MATEKILPIDPKTLSQFPVKGDISSLANKDTINTLKNIKFPTTFGDQIKTAGQVIKAAGDSTLIRLQKEKSLLIQEEKQLDINHQKTLFNLDQQKKASQNLPQSPPPPQLTPLPPNLDESDLAYINDISWKGQTPDKEHGLRQCKSNYNGPCNSIWDGYIHNYVPQYLWEQKFKTTVPDTVEGNDNKDPNAPKPTPPLPSAGTPEEEYQQAVAAENKNYEEAKKILQEKKDKNQKDLDNFLKDPFKKQKEEYKKRKNARKKAQSRNKAERSRARKEKINAILKNGKKTLVPILTLLISNKIAEVISQNQKIKKLVNDTNDIITEANNSGDQTKLNNAKVARDNAIKVIQSNEGKITAIKSQIQNITIYINIFSVIVSIISAIPLPTSVPPGIGIPTSLIIKFIKILEKANKILLALSALVPILTSILDKAIAILQDLKSQLLDINGQLDKAAATGVNSSLLGNNQYGDILGEYKGFKFALREENNPKFVVRGNKRHYAVAIDKQNVEVLKSDYSFTLDPNDLVEQLKLVIDQKNLQG